MNRFPLATAALLSLFSLSAAGASSAQPVDAQPFYFALSVSDAEASSEWYARVLGFVTHRTADLEDRGLRIRLLRRSGALLELVESTEARSASALAPTLSQRFLVHGVFKIGFAVGSLDATLETLQRLEVPLRGRVVEESDGSARSVQIEDPDGNVIQLFELL